MNTETPAFDDLALGKPVLKALNDIGYEKPSPIQAQTIPVLLEGRDVLGQAQTGTGKTAAFALPALTLIDLKIKAPQVMVLAPTRELAIQVAEAFKTYAAHLKGFHVLPIYGGQDYRVQTRALDRGVHVIVGTPGRMMDHMRRGNINRENLRMFTLDEADEMLRMGFIEDVEWILEKLPDTRQMALFSATMPPQIARIASKYLTNPEVVKIEVKTKTADTIRQRFWSVTGRNKLDALTRILEAEEIDAMLIFVRTKTSTLEIADKLEARGYAAAALNGDIQQKQRERTVDQLKRGKLDIIVATDVAARGLDVARVSHVLNYDIPTDTESYIHRIGRTGRAGRKGEAILFVAPREKRMMQTIERATNQSIEQLVLPSTEAINQQRIEKFQLRINHAIENESLGFYENLVKEYLASNPEHTATQAAAAIAHLLQGDVPFLQPAHQRNSGKRSEREHRSERHANSDRDYTSKERSHRERPERDRTDRKKPKHAEIEASPGNKFDHGGGKAKAKAKKPKIPMELYRLAVGKQHDVKAANIIGAIANESGIESQYIGTLTINDDHSTVELPEGMPKAIYKDLKKVWVCGQKLQISRMRDEYAARRRASVESDDKPARKSFSDKGGKKSHGKRTGSNDFSSSKGGAGKGRGNSGKSFKKRSQSSNKAKGKSFGKPGSNKHGHSGKSGGHESKPKSARGSAKGSGKNRESTTS